MEFKEVVSEAKRMLDSLGRIKGRCVGKNGAVPCEECPFNSKSRLKIGYCKWYDCLEAFNLELLPEIEEIVSEWAKKHPKKTYKDVFFENFPDAPKTSDGYPICSVDQIFEIKTAGVYKTNWDKDYLEGE